MAVTKQKVVSQAAFQAVGVESPTVRQVSDQPSLRLGNTPGMSKLRSLKGGGLIRLLLGPDGKQDTHPDIGQSTHGDGVTFAFSSFPLVIGFGPGFRARTVKSKLVQGIAQWLDTAQPSMGFGIGSTLEEDRRGSGQGLQAECRVVAATIIANFGQQPRSQTGSSSGQRLEQIMILRSQKKAFNLLVIGGDLVNHWLQLVEESQQQTGFRAGCHLVGEQHGRLKLGHEALGRRSRSGIVGCSQQRCQLLNGGSSCVLRSRIGSQKS